MSLSVTWLTSPPAKHLPVGLPATQTGQSSSPSKPQTSAAAPADRVAVPGHSIAAEHIRSTTLALELANEESASNSNSGVDVGTGIAAGIASKLGKTTSGANPSLASAAEADTGSSAASLHRKRRKPTVSDARISTLERGLSSLIQDCHSVFAEPNDEQALTPVSSLAAQDVSTVSLPSASRQQQQQQQQQPDLPAQDLEPAPVPDLQQHTQTGRNSKADDDFQHRQEQQPRPASMETSTLPNQSVPINTQLLTQQQQPPPSISRFFVLESLVRLVPGSAHMHEKAVRAFDESQMIEQLIVLRGEWLETELEPGDYVHIKMARTDPDGTLIVDSDDGLLVLHPDYLVPVTTIAESLTCIRRSVLSSRVQGRSTSAPLVFGSVLHEVFQQALQQCDFSSAFLYSKCREVLAGFIDDLWSLSIVEADALDQMQPMIASMQQWALSYLDEKLREGINKKGPVVGGNGTGHTTYQQQAGPSTAPAPAPLGSSSLTAAKALPRSASTSSNICVVDEVLDIEESIWSHKYGIKGFIDVTAKIRVGSLDAEPVLAPVELKTGKSMYAIDSHRAQTMLYALIMSDHHNTDVGHGLLAYLSLNVSELVPFRLNEIRHMIILRNSLVSYFVRRENAYPHLPAIVSKEWACRRCYMLDSCMIYHKMEGGAPNEYGSDPIFAEKHSQIAAKHLPFFEYWDKFITQEEPDMEKCTRELFTLSSQQREQLGRCIAGLQISRKVASDDGDSTGRKGSSNVYDFAKLNGGSISLLRCSMSEGDPVLLTNEHTGTRLSIGTLIGLTAEFVRVMFSKPLDLEALQRSNTVCRLDADEFSAGLSAVRNNLTSIFTDKRFGKCKRMIVDLDAPSFQAEKPTLPLQGLANLNSSQQGAVDHVLRAQDYALVLGMPGTGKTTMIAQAIETLVRHGKTVLLTSYTHSAVDNILLKLKSSGVDFLRVGSLGKIHPDLQADVLQQREKIKSVSDATAYYGTVPIVATTCLGLSHPIFTNKTFDYCIVDEASQIVLPVCLGPVRLASVFILVGDHYQLPPIAKNKAGGSDEPPVSLFKRLSEAHPSAVVVLEQQYRMNADIMSLANAAIYNSRLRSGSFDIANRVVDLPRMQVWRSDLHPIGASPLPEPFPCPSNGRCWLESTLNPRQSVVFLDTGSVPAPETRVGQFVQNEIEAKLVYKVVCSMIGAGVEQGDIGVISPYRSQLRIVGSLLRPFSGVESLTVDRYQGRDKACIVISLVRSNESGKVGDLLQDWRRVNVAITRAKCKLVMIGCKATLSQSPLFSALFKQLDSNGWVLSLPGNAHLMHERAMETICQKAAPSFGAISISGAAASISRRSYIAQSVAQ